MPKYKRKPIIVEAKPYKKGIEDSWILEEYLPKWIDKESLVCFSLSEISTAITRDLDRKVYPYIRTLGGIDYIAKGDYIITKEGERYLCGKDVFEKNYELVEE